MDIWSIGETSQAMNNDKGNYAFVKLIKFPSEAKVKILQASRQKYWKQNTDLTQSRSNLFKRKIYYRTKFNVTLGSYVSVLHFFFQVGNSFWKPPSN